MFEIFIFIILLGFGFFVGSSREKNHYQDIAKRERETVNQVCLTDKKSPKDLNVQRSQLATGSVVIAIDRFKQILFGFRSLLGGEVKSYASLIDRARREAVLRMKEQYPDADLFINVRLETFSISNGERNNTTSVEVFAYGTAIWYVN